MSGKDPLVVAAIARIIAKELGVGEGQVAATIQLIEEGASIPFIARYRKERTGGLDDTQLRTLAERFEYLTILNDRREVVLRSIREDEAAAASLGKNAFRFRLDSFVIGSMLMGLGGAVYAHFVGYIAPEDFLPILTFQLWAMLIVGGSGNNRGALLGAYLVWGFWAISGNVLRGLVPQAEQARAAALQVVLIGVLIALMLVLRPRGLIGEVIGEKIGLSRPAKK